MSRTRSSDSCADGQTLRGIVLAHPTALTHWTAHMTKNATLPRMMPNDRVERPATLPLAACKASQQPVGNKRAAHDSPRSAPTRCYAASLFTREDLGLSSVIPHEHAEMVPRWSRFAA